MTLHRLYVILRTAALGSALLLAFVGCSSARNYGFRDVPEAATVPAYVAQLPRPAPAHASVRAAERPAPFFAQPALLAPLPQPACAGGG